MINLMKNEIMQRTENGALGWATSGSTLLDMNFKIPYYRNDKVALKQDFKFALNEDFISAALWAFYARDVRGNGAGERDLFKTVLPLILDNMTSFEARVELIRLIAEYGRWDDLLCLIGLDSYTYEAAVVIAFQLRKDLAAMQKGEPVSLLAKWLPRENASSKDTRIKASIIYKRLGIDRREYRKIITTLTRYLDVVEVKISEQNWKEIDYSKLPSGANLRYKNTFQNFDGDRYVEFLQEVEDGKAKMNVGTLFPHQILHQVKQSVDGWVNFMYRSYRDEDKLRALNTMWNQLPGDGADVMVVQDSSGSMETRVSGELTAMTIAQALAIYFAERCRGPYKNKFISFSRNPQYIDISYLDTIEKKYEYVSSKNIVENTDIEAVFDLILRTAVKHDLKQDELPKTVLILSDMEFDAARGDRFGQGQRQDALMDTIRRKFERAGYSLPKLAFWNLASRTNTIPMQENENGLVLLSGFSQKLVKLVESDQLNPLDALMEELYSARYEPVYRVLKGYLND